MQWLSEATFGTELSDGVLRSKLLCLIRRRLRVGSGVETRPALDCLVVHTWPSKFTCTISPAMHVVYYVLTTCS